jgi:polyribonucleotide nucleotidyltransferase
MVSVMEPKFFVISLLFYGVNGADVMSINAASSAWILSDIPWHGAVRVSFCNNEIIINPTGKEQSQSILKLVVSAAGHNLF